MELESTERCTSTRCCGGNCGFLTLYLHTLLLIISPTLCLPVPHLLAKPLKFGQCPPRNFHSIQFHNMLRCTCDGCMLDWIGLDWQVKVIVNVSQGTIQMLTTGLCHWQWGCTWEDLLTGSLQQGRGTINNIFIWAGAKVTNCYWVSSIGKEVLSWRHEWT